MKLTVKIYRVTTIRTKDLIGAAEGDNEKEYSAAQVREIVKKKFYPQPSLFKIFYNSSEMTKTLVGTECMAFDITEANVPMAGISTLDPITPRDIDRLDGAVESELNRMGIYTDFEGYEWRATYEVFGN